MSKNKLRHLNDHLFAQIERLSEEGLEGIKMHEEVQRSKALASLAHQVLGTHVVVLKAHEALQKDNIDQETIEKMTGYDNDEIPPIQRSTKEISGG